MTRTRLLTTCLSAALALATGCQDSDTAASGGPGGAYAADAGSSWDPGSGAGGGGAAYDGAEAPPPQDDQFYPGEDQFEDVGDNPWVDTAEDPMSTFSVDTDTASYTLARRALLAGELPSPDAVRVEEFINFFKYDYPAPAPDAEVPFRVDLEGAPSPFGAAKHLLRIGLKGTLPAQRKPANLVFLVDVSGSMRSRLPLVKTTLNQLIDALRPDDTIAIVTYAGQDRVALPPTPVEERAVILDAVYDMTAGGGTNGADGLRTAYLLAEEHNRADGINRVVLCTDGDFNVGVTGDALVDEVVSWRERGISLSVFGYGHGNFNDQFLERLTNEGEGTYRFIDSPNAALRAVGSDLVAGMEVIAKDVKIQVEFAPEQVARFRLIGYVNRVLAHEDFTDDTVDAGEIGAGHFVTAFYELELAAEPGDGPLATVRLRHKAPEGGDSVETTHEAAQAVLADTFEAATADFRFGAAVTEFAEVLHHSEHAEGHDFAAIKAIAEGALGDPTPDRAEFIELVDVAAGLWDAP